jgi:hypothetical protein
MAFFILLPVYFFSGCGGVEEEGKSASSSSLTPGCSGSYCGASGLSYTGNGVGVWSYINDGTYWVNLNVSLSNVANRDITIVFTNTAESSVNMPYIPVNTALHSEMSPKYAKHTDTFNRIPDFIRDFNPKDLLSKSQNMQDYPLLLAKTYSKGDERKWDVSVEDKQGNSVYENRTATLKEKQTLSNGLTVNIWVENSEYASDKVNDAIISRILQSLETIVVSAENLIGKPWGTRNGSYYIPSDQPLDITLVNFDKNGKAGGVLGYFWGINNVLNNEIPASWEEKGHSNEALVVFVDTETLYKDANGTLYGISTIAHEFTHAVHFYQRYVLMNDGFDTFLNEMSAIMMEDIIAKKIDNEFNDAKFRYIDWHKESDYRYDFADWSLGGDRNYDVAGSFGAYLLRQHGVEFYKTLFKTRGDSSANCGESNTPACRLRSLKILDKAIKTYNGEGLKRALSRWGASIAMFPSNASPNGFGYPVKYSGGFEFEEFDGSAYKQYRTLPTSSPASLPAHGHFPFLRKGSSGGSYSETFSVPPNVSVSIVVK